MKTHYILFHVLDYKDEPNNAEAALQGFDNKCERIVLPNGKSRKLGENSWLLHRDTANKPFAELVIAAEAQHLKYEVLWLTSDE